MNRNVLIALAVGVAALVAALLWTLSGGKPESSDPAPQPSPRAGDTSSERPEPTERPHRGDPGTRPTLESPPTATPAPQSREYLSDDGVVIRDHRAGNPPPRTGPAPARPVREPQTIDSKRILAVRAALRPAVHRCADEHRSDAQLGEDPRLQTVVTVQIAGDRVTATEVEMQVEDVGAPDALMECVRRAALAIDVPAEGHADVSSHALTLPFKLRR